MRRPGFTAVELAIVLSISALLAPLIYVFVRQLTAVNDDAHFELEVAAAVRELGEQLERDALRTECDAKWRLEEDGRLVRAATEACGGAQVMAKGVTRFERRPDGVELTFTRRLSVEQKHSVDVFLAEVVP